MTDTVDSSDVPEKQDPLTPRSSAPKEHRRTPFEVAFDLAVKVLITGPDPPRPGDPPSAGALFPWWLRLAAVFTAYAIGRLWADTGIGQELAWGLDYAALVAVSLAASYWKPIFAVNLGLALLWSFLPLRSPRQNRRLWRLHHLVTFANRQLGHLEAFATWITVSLVAYPRLTVQLPAVAAVVLLGPPLINGLAHTRVGVRGATKASGELNWARRPIIYAFTLIGLIVLAAQAPRQVQKLIPGILAIALGGVLPRYLRHRRRTRVMRRESPDRLDLRRTYRDVQMGWPRRLDAIFAGVLIGAMLAAIAVAWQRRQAYEAAHRAATAPAGTERADVCTRDPGGPKSAEASLFIVSDSQLHELQGDRFPGQAELADAFVPVALRPVELDLLSVASFRRFGTVYRQLAAAAAAEGRAMPWTHLGDLADLACADEMARMRPLFAAFSKIGPLAGIAPGNHDKSFTGNFFWSPFWDRACRRRLEKLDSDAMLRDMASRDLMLGARMAPVDHGPRLGRLITRRGSALVTVTPLGAVTHLGVRRGLIAVFLDSTDELDFDFGVAGLFGTISRAQVSTVLRLIREVQAAQHAPYDDPVYLVLKHHPNAELTPDSKDRLQELIARLDGGPDPQAVELSDDAATKERAREIPPRVVALISAHTHRAQAAYHCIGRRRFIRELVVGSTTDAPQEAALLTVGPDETGTAAVRLRTLPAVARPERTCGNEPAVEAASCQRLAARLRAHPDCGDLFRTDDRLNAPDCQELERDLTLSQRLEAITRSKGPTTPAGIKAAQVVRARRLFSCICRGGSCQPPQAALNLTHDAAYDEFLLRLMETGTPPTRSGADVEQELTCLSWAAAAVQEHKAAGMEMGDALRCAFDDPTTPAAKDYVADLRMRECR